MTFKPKVWFPIATVLSAINLAAVWFAARPGEPWHAATHAALALAFGLWAQRLRSGPVGTSSQPRLEAIEALDGLQVLDAEVGQLRQELGETLERLEFAERMLAQRPDRRAGPPS
jgi:hypothetical protein